MRPSRQIPQPRNVLEMQQALRNYGPYDKILTYKSEGLDPHGAKEGDLHARLTKLQIDRDGHITIREGIETVGRRLGPASYEVLTDMRDIVFEGDFDAFMASEWADTFCLRYKGYIYDLEGYEPDHDCVIEDERTQKLIVQDLPMIDHPNKYIKRDTNISYLSLEADRTHGDLSVAFYTARKDRNYEEFNGSIREWIDLMRLGNAIQNGEITIELNEKSIEVKVRDEAELKITR